MQSESITRFPRTLPLTREEELCHSQKPALQNQTEQCHSAEWSAVSLTRENFMQESITPLSVQKSVYIIRLRQVIEKTGLSRGTIYNLIKSGDFPKQIHLSVRTMGFLESEVDAWIAGRVAASRMG
ncbi:MAG: AlpA family transcriptional regulator [Methylotenera sp.]|nr:AlpA family transcriptional regulator [Methylotenera sp.]